MDKEIKKKLEICRKNLSADKLKKGKEWNGFSVYVPVRKESFEGGWPQVVLVKDDKVRLSTYEECFAYIAFIKSK